MWFPARLRCFSNVHKRIRDLINFNVSLSRADIEDVIHRYKEVNAGDAIGISAYSVEEDDPSSMPIDKISILLDWDNVRLNLNEKNQSSKNMSKWYVSGSYL